MLGPIFASSTRVGPGMRYVLFHFSIVRHANPTPEMGKLLQGRRWCLGYGRYGAQSCQPGNWVQPLFDGRQRREFNCTDHGGRELDKHLVSFRLICSRSKKQSSRQAQISKPASTPSMPSFVPSHMHLVPHPSLATSHPNTARSHPSKHWGPVRGPPEQAPCAGCWCDPCHRAILAHRRRHRPC